jgi:hypothetical protein
LPTTCVPRTDKRNRKCHTAAVSWLNGAHPSAVDGKVARTVCFSWSGNCCRWRKDIGVINCGLFYIYKLGSTPVCSLRYCGIDVWILKGNQASNLLLKLICATVMMLLLYKGIKGN